ncbi:c-type cytochrome [Prosthecobacter sp. SYSU 5D2]|uniref:DUF7133 domain-containing protein n=1 Tax=Prosthecobacter sp. SYSU 5D2 TaxID=3134134 RepID=UPI0031FF4483
MAGSLRGILNTDGKVFPISAPVRRFNWASATQTLTAACSPVPWFDGQHYTMLVCEPAHNLVHREVLDYTRFPLTTRRHPEDETAEFIASTDHWFRPSLVREGPDGALYLADMYRLVLEHPEWIPDGIARGLNLRAGEDRGRLYRIATPASASKLSTLPLPPASAMRSPHRWQRDTAQRLLLEKADPTAASWLRELAADSSASTAVRIQAAWTVHLLTGQDQPALVALLRSAHPQVRGAALTTAGDFDIHADELASWFPEKAAPVAAPALPAITHTSPDRAAVVEKYLAAIAPLEGDARRGDLVYQKACMACHRLGSAGAEVGPDLATVAAKPVAQILEAIFDPNRAVEQRNVTTQITRTDGSILAGILSAETPSAITLRLPGGVDFPVPRADIRSLKTLPTSLMPEGLESILTPQETADLIRRIQSS